MSMRPVGVTRRVRERARATQAGRALGLVNALSPLVRLYGGTDKLSHGYTEHYERHVGPRRLERLVVFEIGVGGYSSLTPGGSLAVWRDYFLRSRIVGLDIEDKTVRLGSRVAFERVDQSNREQLAEVVTTHGVPDIVIDDGSHVGAHIRASFDYLWPLMHSRSIYVIEDLSTSYYPTYEGADPPPPSSAMGLLTVLMDSVQALDTTFERYPQWGRRSAPQYPDVSSLHVHPGIAFVVKA